MSYVYAISMALMALVSIAMFLWGFDLNWRMSKWRVEDLRREIEEERARSDMALVIQKLAEASEVTATRLEKLDVSVGNLVMRTFSQTTKVKERQVGESAEAPLDFPQPPADRARSHMYKPEGFVEVTASERALGKPT